MKKLFTPVVVSVVLLVGTGYGTPPHPEALATARGGAVICPVAAALEAQTMAAAPKCIASTVGLFINSQPPGTGSGVVVSADGLILTVGHVVEKAGVPLTIRFTDGRVALGVTLGADIEADTGMVRITDVAPAGGWPFSPMAPADSARPGEWVLAAGHPGGIVGDRNPPLRLGRVTGHDKKLINSDCAIEPGDSGGPLFDLTGRVVGVSSSILLDDAKHRLAENITVHIPVNLYSSQWKDLLAGNIRRGRRSRHSAGPAENASQLPRAMLGLGKTSLAALAPFAPALDAAGQCVVEVRSHNKPILMGTIVDADGWIVTKASELRANPQVVLANGTALDAKVVGVDKATDLALLKVNAKGLTPANFSDRAPLGAWLASPLRDPNQPAVGVISVTARPIPGTFAHLGGENKVKIGINFKDEACQVGEVIKGMPAEAAGFKAGDKILQLNGQPVSDSEGLSARVMQGKAGDTLTFKVRREGKELELRAVLGEVKSITDTENGVGEDDDVANGKLSKRRTNLPLAIQHDGTVWADQCGGPLINLQGQTIGINIARYDRVCTFALPADLVQKTITKMRAAQTNGAAAEPADVAAGPDDEKSTLVIGDAAPALAPSKWIKGQAVSKFEPGKIYIVEFWATWCGPCKASIPHLTELQKQNPGVTFIGMNCMEEDQSGVPAFVAKMGDKMNYRVAMDDADGRMAKAWLEAADQDGIPTAFLIGKDSKIAWIGHPTNLGDVLKQVLAGTFDPQKAAAKAAADQEVEELAQKAVESQDLAAIDKLVKNHPDLAADLMAEKFGILAETKDYPAAIALGKQLVESQKGNADLLNAIAWMMVDPENPIDKPDLDLALKAALRANEASKGEAAEILDTLARVYFARGDVDNAIKIETKAVRKSDMGKTLAEYKAKKKMPK